MNDESMEPRSVRGALEIDGERFETLMIDGDEYVPRRAIAKMFHRNNDTIRRWENERSGPPFIAIGSSYWYSLADVRRWMAQGARARQRTIQRRRVA